MSTIDSSAEDSEQHSEVGLNSPSPDMVASVANPPEAVPNMDIASKPSSPKRTRAKPAPVPPKAADSTAPKDSADPATMASAILNDGKRRNSMPRTDAELVASIQKQMVEVNRFSAQAGAGSVKALNRYRDIGQMVLDEKRLGRFKKPNPSIRDWCNEHLAGVVGGSSAYAMVGLSTSLAKHWEPLSAEFKRREEADELIGPLGLQSALKLGRQLALASGDAKPKKAKAVNLNTRARDTFRALAATYRAAIKANVSPAKVAASLTEIVEATRRSIQQGGFAKVVASELVGLPVSFEIEVANGVPVKAGKKVRGGGKKG